ncbi:MAG: hypothetical protein JNM57_11665 [Cyclobacteriaceae bacterium]|nr:hypothetical protein [Cyclobacteriaceae bacterium]
MVAKTCNALVVLLILTFPVKAQQDSSGVSQNGIRYTNSFLSGGLFGEKGNGNTLSFSTIHGIRYGRWMTGVGIGYDTYLDWNVMPLIGAISFDFDRVGKNAMYIQLAGGYGIPWQREIELEGSPSYEASGGHMINPMLGYRIKVDRYSLYVSAGYKFQRINYSYSNQYWWWWGDSPLPTSTSHIQQDMNRISIQIGFGLH